MANKYTIRAISKSCGILPHTLRAWESRYSAFEPERAENGQRLYSDEDLQKANLLGELTQEGHSISVIASLSMEELQKLKSEKQSAYTGKLKDHKEAMISSLSNYDIEGVVKEMNHLKAFFNTRDFIFMVVLPSLKKIGQLVAEGEFSVTQEHILSNLIRDELSQLRPPQVNGESRKTVIATPDGNMHDLSILIADILCRFYQFPSHFLGASHPSESLAEAINALQCTHVILGVLSSDKWDYDRDIERYLSEVDSKLEREVEVLLGGGMAREFPSFQKLKRVQVLANYVELENHLKELT